MRLLVKMFLAFQITNAAACESELAVYLDQATLIAVDLPQVNQQEEEGRQFADESWINNPVESNTGGYRYLLHDIAIAYVKLGCLERAESVLVQIKNAGVVDSARAGMAIALSKRNEFDDAEEQIRKIKYAEAGRVARTEVSNELVRVGQLAKAKEMLRRAGLFGNHYESYWYLYAMSLAKNGRHAEALEYVSEVGLDDVHAKNSLGDMLLLFQSNGDQEAERQALTRVLKGKVGEVQAARLTAYYLRKSDFDGALKYAKMVNRPNWRFNLLLEVFRRKKDRSGWNVTIVSVEKEFNKNKASNWTNITNVAPEVYLMLGKAEVVSFLSRHLGSQDDKAKYAHKNVAKSLIENGRFSEVFDYFSTHEMNSFRLFYESIAAIKSGGFDAKKNLEQLLEHGFEFKRVVVEMLKAGYPASDVLPFVRAQADDDSLFFRKSELLRVTGMVASAQLGHGAAVGLYDTKSSKLQYAYWLLGVSEAAEAKELSVSRRYRLHL